MALTHEHNWQQDPEIPQVVKGVSGPGGSDSGVLLTEDVDTKALLQETVLLLREAVLHLRTMTGEEFNECDLRT
jgi:hypothetical protein